MSDPSFAETRQSEVLLRSLRAELPALAADVAADVGEPSDLLEPVVAHVLAGLSRPGRLPPAELERLRAEGAAAARAGSPVQVIIDRYLSTGWVVWARARELIPDAEAGTLAALGAALLRAGDDAAAALAGGYSAVERQLATRAGAARRALVDELLLSGPAEGQPVGRLVHQATLAGLVPDTAHRLVVIRAAEPFEDEDPALETLGRILARSPGREDHLLAARGGDLLLVLAEPWRSPAILDEVRAGLDRAGAWWAVAMAGLESSALAGAVVEARTGLDVVRRLGREREFVPLAAIALDRALAADERLLRLGIAAWLGPLLEAPRGGEALVATLEAWLAAGQSVTATARTLGLGPRTISYRLARIAALLGRSELDAEARLHLATALLGRRLLPEAGLGGGRGMGSGIGREIRPGPTTAA